jgi:putative flavoprotein involved in K+ transport
MADVHGHIDALVIGGGQAGLAVAYHLDKRGIPATILDENQTVGASWRNRWDALRLFTPAPYDGLPGMPFPGRRSTYPTKDQMADYLASYVERFRLDVRTGARVERLSREGASFTVYSRSSAITADYVVVATGAYQKPRIPDFAGDLDPGIVQLHSKEYRNPSQLRDGRVLVVGAGNSGSEIALDVARDHEVWLSGPDTGQEPTRAGSIADRLITPLMWLGATRLTVETRAGRKMRDRFLNPPRGIPLGRARRKDIAAAGIERMGRTIGVHDGRPVLDDGRVVEAANVIWCTGFDPDFSWIDLPIALENGYPRHKRGVIDSEPGLFFVGLQFLYSLSSALVGGAGRDAEHIVGHIAADRLANPRGQGSGSMAGGRPSNYQEPVAGG